MFAVRQEPPGNWLLLTSEQYRNEEVPFIFLDYKHLISNSLQIRIFTRDCGKWGGGGRLKTLFLSNSLQFSKIGGEG